METFSDRLKYALNHAGIKEHGSAAMLSRLLQVTPKAVVVAKLIDADMATFKKLVIDAGKRYLKPLNPNYRTIEVNGNCQIIGVIREAKIKF